MAAALWVAAHHPLAPVLAGTAAISGAALAVWRPFLVPVALLAVMPVAGLAPWTGWMLAEEFDLLALALLAGGWARMGWPAGLPQRPPYTDGAVRVWWLLVLPYLGLTAVSAWHGLRDAGAWDSGTFAWGWWQGWREPMNVLRTVKPLVLAMLAWPLWQALQARAPEAASRAVGHGAWAGLVVVTALCVWERWQWTGLANFSTDHRTTALFWETHVGGAALDGFLALTLPFGLWQLAAAGTPRRRWLALAVLLLAGYAVLTTFSRALVVAVLLGSLVWWALAMLGRPADRWSARLGVAVARPVSWVALFAVVALLAFPGSGWRGQAALWGVAALLFYGWHRGAAAAGSANQAVAGAAAGAVVAVPLVALAVALPDSAKAPYVVYVGLAGLVAWAWARDRRWPVGWGAWAAMLVAAVGVAVHWGERPERWLVVASVMVLAAAAAAGVGIPAWRGPVGASAQSTWRTATLAAMAMVSLVVGLFAGGVYMDERLASIGQDLKTREQHWSRAVALAEGSGESAWWGIGPGRFAAHFALSGATFDQVGDYRWQPLSKGGGALLLTSGKHMLGLGEMFRMSQRIALPVGAVEVRWRAEVQAPVQLQVEICDKHLIYPGTCRAAPVSLEPAAGDQPPRWLAGRVTLKAFDGWRDPVFSVALESRSGVVRFDEIQLTDSQGQNLLRNGGFDDGLARWLPSSDRHHLPWHAKNLAVHLRVEQGWLGLAGFASLLAFTAARLTVGRARQHFLAPPLLAGIVGFLIVGAFDSLLDIPRVTFALLWLLGVAATLQAPAPDVSALRARS